ncbi:hypothetical protein P170DRAFT_432945 [Aspergillus steynii IBT 23096]|uniref:Uncharacterized protein n=1 Tax=Aspergillus steynii IBT 23096 TaxID=1392250 RepID=A0A2I2GR99_9EURO|nr:uncharacterized protein P170DRAFT_432945 [Aspergillus steynii IBT 23096]PLB55402.1 hypothetical protein P170DRAFT_432945 [Aspergillus steynii IBT 23096]
MYPNGISESVWIDNHRVSRQLLRLIRREATWGYVVYRTTYTPESNTQFPKVLEMLETWIKREIYKDLNDLENADPAPNNEIWARHRFTVIEDENALNGATIDTVRAHFEQWVEDKCQRDMWNKYRICMVIDDDILQRLVDVPTPEQHAEQHGDGCLQEIEKWYVKVIEPFFDPYNAAQDYEGWMNCSVYVLVRLWHLMDAGMDMETWFSAAEDGVYLG